MKEDKDDQLWQQAKARADFKTHLTTYVIINGIVWLIWLLTTGTHSYPWPIWPTLGWGIGLLTSFIFNNRIGLPPLLKEQKASA